MEKKLIHIPLLVFIGIVHVVKIEGVSSTHKSDDNPIKYNFRIAEYCKDHEKNIMKYAINGQIPGPPIIVDENDEVEITVTNNLPSAPLSGRNNEIEADNKVTIHWHGLHQKNTYEMDGVPDVTTTPASEDGGTSKYTFKASPAGTHWYHSHYGYQRDHGLFGVFIVTESNPNKDEKNIGGEVIMTIGDFYQFPEKFDPDEQGNREIKVYLQEGKGSYSDFSINDNKIEVAYDKQYRFRVIHAGAEKPLRVSIDDHKLRVFASDGYKFKYKNDEYPKVESIVLNPGERYDFFLKTFSHANVNRNPNYWIRVCMEEEACFEQKVILKYPSEPNPPHAPPIPEKPETKRKYCTKETCNIINCSKKKEYATCISLDQLNGDLNPRYVDKDIEKSMYFLFSFVNMNKEIPKEDKDYKASINGKLFKYGDNKCTYKKPKCCGDPKTCSHEISLEIGKRYRMIWVNNGQHPIHMHGHSFYLIKMVETQNDIVCYPWGRNGLPGDCYSDTELNFKSGVNPDQIKNMNPIRKDTLLVPPDGYAIIEFDTDNKGKWFTHCHLDRHTIEGMAMVLNEGI